jgi:membrane fusion protein, heavy metal efflux system
MESNEHPATAWGRGFLWGGIVLGVILVALMLTHGFGLLTPRSSGDNGPVQMVRKDDKILIPDGSALRARLTVAPVQAESVSPRLELPGIVESDPARTATVLSPLSGRVSELKVALGDRVRRGQVLALIDSPDLAQAYDDDEKAADAAELTHKNLERQEGQFKLGAASTRDLDQTRSDATQASSEYVRTQARLKVLGVDPDSHHRHSGKPNSILTISAPANGSITTLTIAPGNMINDPTQPLMTVADLSTVWVTALVPEKDVASVAKDQEAEVRLLAYPGRVLRGKVLFVSDVIESDSRREKLRIAFENPLTELKPNMFASVILVGGQQTRVVLPTSALLMNNDRTTVFVATAPWTFERRVVQPELEEGTRVAIQSGLKPGEQVVVKGGILLND